MIPFVSALRRRLMIDTGPGFVFKYTGNFTDNRKADGTGKVKFKSSGTLTVIKGTATISAYILGAGGGAASASYHYIKNGTHHYCQGFASGGGGGYQTVTVTLEEGESYNFTIGLAGEGDSVSKADTQARGGNGGKVVAFGYTSNGGTGGTAKAASLSASATAGKGGNPNGKGGTTKKNVSETGVSPTLAGGLPNGGEINKGYARSAGEGYVEITFS